MSVFFLSVSVRPKSTQVFVGDDVSLICNREGGSKTTQWFINGTQQTHQDYLMHLTAVTPKDNGVYKCEQGGTSSEPYTLSVLGMNTVLNVHDRLLLLRFLMISLSLSLSQSWSRSLSSLHHQEVLWWPKEMEETWCCRRTVIWTTGLVLCWEKWTPSD